MAQTEPPPPPSAPSARPKPKIVPLPVKRELSAQHRDELHSCGLDDATIAAAELYTELNPRMLALMLERSSYPRTCGAALVFPFYLPAATEPHAYRIKPMHPRTERRRGKQRLVKYDQSSRAGVLMYFAPRARFRGGYSDVTSVCVWTEGEKKSLCLDQLGYECVGLTGVWNWSDSSEREASGADLLHPAVRDYVAIAGRKHLICFDGDASDNKHVMDAADRLAGLLWEQGATDVRFVTPPSTGPKGIDDYFAAHGPDAVRALLATARVIEGVDPKRPRPRIRTMKGFIDAPLHKEAALPDGFDLRKDGSLWKHAANPRLPDALVSRAPVFIQRQFVDHDSGEGRAEVCYREGDGWVSRQISQLAVGDSRTMVSELTPFGVPVTSVNAPRLVDWLHVYEGLNVEFISRVTGFSRAGWHDCEGRIFVTDVPVLPEDRVFDAVVTPSGPHRDLLTALKPCGSFDDHLAALRRAWAASPICAAVICGALAAPLLKPLHAPNFGIHLIGESSRGKTSMLKIAASVYGDPNNPQWVAAWNTTNVGAELRAAMLTDLPQCYDEAGGGDPVQLERLMYMLINGTGRTRARRDATIRETLTWHTVVLSTGEVGLASEETATGAQVRVVQLHVDGFGSLGAADIDALGLACAEHAGQFGRQWVEMLVDISDWSSWRERLAQYTKFFRTDAHNTLHGRVAAYFALLQVAEQFAWEFGLAERGSQVMLELFRAAESRVVVEGTAERARRFVQDWVQHDPDGFPELTPGGTGDVGGPARPGIRLEGYRRTDGTLLIIPSQFREFCKKHRLSADEVVRQWAGRSWLEVEPGRFEKRQRVNGKQSRFITLKPEPEDTQ